MSHDEQQNEISRKPGKTVKTIYFVLIWFGVILALSLAGAFTVHDGQLPVPLIIALVVPILVYVLDRSFLKGAALGGIHRMSQSTCGVVFLETKGLVGVKSDLWAIRYSRALGQRSPKSRGISKPGAAARRVGGSSSAKRLTTERGDPEARRAAEMTAWGGASGAPG
jgi:hypothetical protein